MNWLASIPVPVWQAVVAGAFVATGWLVNGWQNRRVAALLRAERLRDVHRAIYAEIGANLANLGSAEDLESWRTVIISRIAADDAFVPFIPKERADRVFEAIVENIHVLPRSTIDPIVVYYGQIEKIAALADDMRADGFARLSADRRRDIYSDYIEMKKQAFAFGSYALVLINAYAKGGAAQADKVANREKARLSTPGADLSGP